VIALVALAAFFGVGVLLVIAMFAETRRENACARTPRPKPVAATEAKSAG
jgi:hypothetical protein